MKKIIIILIIILMITGCKGLHTKEYTRFVRPDLKNDFCGPVMHYEYCKCAFHGLFCGKLDITQQEADAYVNAEHEKYVEQKYQEFKSSCEARKGYFYEQKNACIICKEGYEIGQSRLGNPCVKK